MTDRVVELRETLIGLAAQIEADIKQWVEAGRALDGAGFNPERQLDANGRPIMLDYLTRLASVYVALANLEAMAQEIRVETEGIIRDPRMFVFEPPEPEVTPLDAHKDDPLYESAVQYHEAVARFEKAGYPRHRPLSDNVEEVLARLDLLVGELEHVRAANREHEERLLSMFERFEIRGVSIASMLERVLVEGRQYREAHAHAQQLRDYYRGALSALVTDISDGDDLLLHVGVKAATAARQALDNPPEWDGRLR